MGAALAALFVAAAVAFGPRLLDGSDYADVASIEQDAAYRDPRLLAEAWRLPVASLYGPRGFEYQSNPSFCGPATVANALNSLGRPATQQRVIDGTRYDTWFGVLPGGMTLDELAELLRQRTQGTVTILRGADLGTFREHMRLTNTPSRRYFVNFHRGPLFARGHGHFSPILGYLEAQDLVFVGDVNRDYEPFLVRTERLWAAAATIDSATGQPRGLIVLEVASD